MDREEKYKCYDNAVKALPEKMSVRDLLVFMHGLCAAFNSDSESIGLALMMTAPSDNDDDEDVVSDLQEKVKMHFSDEKLQQLLGKQIMDKYQVKVTRDLTESVSVTVEADNSDKAEDMALDIVENQENPKWEIDEGSQGCNGYPYVSDCEVIEDD